jgi:Fe-S cluster assembly protein SufD
MTQMAQAPDVPDVKHGYVADFQAFARNGGARAPGWLTEIREAAIARFAELGFPSTKQEEWRFTSVARLAETRFRLTTASAQLPDTIASLLLGTGSRLVFVDGRYVAALSSVDGLPKGAHVGSLGATLETAPDLARQHLARHARYQSSPFAALNTAFLSDGAFVYVPAGVELDRPIELVFLATARRGPAVAHPRSLVVVERGARATVVESYVALEDGLYWTNAVTELAVGDGARLECYRVQRESRQAYHIATTHATQGRDSVLRLHPLAFGGGLARHDIYTVLAGAGADLILNGFYLARGAQHADHHTVIDHAQPHCASHEFFNGILGEQARGVFNGRIIVRPGAQRTDSKQTNNNLLLSAAARADSQPQLEIYADDVKCTHGSTVGPLDQTALYYLRSRGLSTETATGMLTYGFAAEILGRMEHPELRNELDRMVRARLADRSQGGRRGEAGA